MARTGRPREFDREEALEQATLLFWRYGYDATSLDQIKRAMGGIGPASFYAAFGSKEALFKEAVRHYIATYGKVTAPFRDESLPPLEAIERGLRASARMQTDGRHPSGCFLALSSGYCLPEDAEVQELLRTERQGNRDGIRAHVGRAIARGDLPGNSDAEGIAAMFDGMLLGFSIQARDMVPFERIDASITAALASQGAA